ncbi:MAG: hypothetical protein ACTS2F_09085 [Thainema sp.]
MNRIIGWVSGLALVAIAGCSGSTPNAQAPSANSSTSETITAAAEPTVIELTQTGCQFLEVENRDYGYTPASAEQCEEINAETIRDRESAFQPLQLAAGEYIFRVANQDVPYELGFYLRGKGIQQATLPKVSGGGLTEGTTQEYRVTLKPGEYVFSCPLNPTPDYPIVVQ